MKIIQIGVLGLAVAVFASCDTALLGPQGETALVRVEPTGGATDVATSQSVVVTFDGAMHHHATDYMAVHEGGVTGPVVEGQWAMHGDTAMAFMPHEPLHPGTHYAVHLGGGITDADGDTVDLGTHGPGMGGAWADHEMMGGGMMGGSHPHTGHGWAHGNGSYGMVFEFGTAGTAPSRLVSVQPEGGATDVDPTAPIILTFSHPMDSAMVDYVALHEGDVNGPVVPGTWALAENATQLVFTQDEPLKAATEYTLHLGGGMMDGDGGTVEMQHHGTQMGGEWVDGSMMMGAGGTHGHGGGDHPHMGGGWQHPDNGSYGMIFSFITAG